MNAKKIMGAVLVALLAAALFVGAGAAAGIPTVFVYETTSLTGTWVSEDGKNDVTFVSGAILGENIVEGIYYDDGAANSIYVKYPTAQITTTQPGILGNTIAPGNTVVSTVFQAAKVGYTDNIQPGVIFTHPDGYLTKNFDGTVSGEWKVQAYFGDLTPSPFNANMPSKYLYGQDVYTFTVGSSDVTLSVDKDAVVQGNNIIVSVTGKPATSYFIKATGVAVEAINGQPAYIATNNGFIEVKTGSDGKASIAIKTKGNGDLTLEVYAATSDENAKATADVTVEKGVLTAAAKADSYFIGTDIKLTGTNTIGGTLYFYIDGTNIPVTPLTVSGSDFEKDGDSWSATIKAAEYGFVDAGTYTIYVATASSAANIKAAGESYTTASVALKQPFITITEAPEVVVKGTEAEIKGTAEATKHIAYYIFGTNKFLAATNDADSRFAVIDTQDIEVKNGKYTITLNETVTDSLDAGQYFIVIQHPMYDTFFNIYSTADNISVASTIGGVLGAGTALFDVDDRQKANAAQALCDELDAQKIDDMYVKASFIVAAGTSSINPIPSEIVKGEKLTVSGKTNGGEGTLVTVDMMSTAFAAVPKETVGSASFISLTTKTDKDGNWEVTFDTTGLNVDEYTVTAAVDQFGSTTAKVNVVEKAPVTPEQPDTPDVPDVPEQPTEPEAPATPGFGALAALAGLGAVAVLLLRRE